MSSAEDSITVEVVKKLKGPIDLADEQLIEITRDPATFISGPVLSASSSIAPDVLQYQQSLGFNCQRLFNLCLICPDVLVFASGNFIHFFTISTRTMSTRRSSTGGGIGYITKNPNPAYNFLTVAENGASPPIIIYNYPQMKVIALCEGGTECSYTYVDYSPDGEMMASQGGGPDFMITLWKWKSGVVILRTRSFQNTVFKVAFSLYIPGQLSTSGVGHIKFWKICETFTGLKLVGEHGRFGKTEICDIVGAYSMPLGSSLSGSEWGNILVWEEGLIKFEVCRKNRQRCHAGAIAEIYLHDGEVMTVGKDGYVRIWFWETVELADPPDDDLFVEIDPIYEYCIGSAEHRCSLHALVKRDDVSWWWYAQDANGGLWMADISPENKPQPSQMLFRCHAGEIVALGACPYGPYIATFGDDGRLHVYNYLSGKLVFHHQFGAKGRCLLWLPLTVDASGNVLLLGFDDGLVRLVCIDPEPRTRSREALGEPRLRLLQVWKPHRLALTAMSINQRCSVLVTGAEDNTLFIHQVYRQEPFVKINAIGFVDIPSAATALNWKPNMLSTLIVGCLHGQVLEMDVPERPRSYTDLSYQLTHIEYKTFVFQSKKSELRREIKLQEIERLKLAKRERKQRSLERLRTDNPDIKIDEEAFLADSESDEELETIYIPPVPNRVLWLMYTVDNTIWLSMGQYDCGYVYEFAFGKDPSMQCTPIANAEDLEINSYLYFDDYLVFGMEDGSVRINRVLANYRDLSDYWSLTMHDNANGRINAIVQSYDHKHIFTVGDDGNIFTYKWNCKFLPPNPPMHQPTPFPDSSVKDVEDPAALSLEQQKQKNNRDKRSMIANQRKEKVLAVIESFRTQFVELMARNRRMLVSQRIDETAIVLDQRITDSLQQSLDGQAQLVKRKLAFNLEKNRLLVKKVQEYFIEPLEDLVTEVFALRSDKSVKTFRVNALGNVFNEMTELVKKMIQIELDSKRVIQVVEDTGPEVKTQEIKRLESFLEVLTASTIEFRLGLQPSRLLKKYRARKEAERLSKEQWDYINSIVPDINKNDPKDDAALREAAATIGDYKLRTDPAYVSTEEESSSVSKKYQQVLAVREELGTIRSDFNVEVFQLRAMKQHLTAYIGEKRDHLKEVHKEIREDLREYTYEFGASREEMEFPERAIQLRNATAETFPNIAHSNQFNYFTYNLKQIDIFIANEERYKTMLKESDRSSNLLIELIQTRLDERIFEQREQIDDIEMRIKRFDQEISHLRKSRLQIEVAAKYLDVFLLTLNQELWVLRDFKQLEDKLVGNVNEKIIAQNEINAELTALKLEIEQHRKNIDKGGLDSQLLTTQFTSTATGNKFWDFLRKIYKKKFRVARVIDPDDYDVSSESSDESSSEEEDDAESHDSAEIGPIHIDENVCPAGCDRNLYDLTFDLRSRRHLVEQNIKDENAAIDECRSKIEQLNKRRKVVEVELGVRNDELQTFLTIKQKTLNEIDCLVILKMGQMQYFVNHDQFVDIENTLLFNNDAINSLYARVAEIELETMRAREQHRINVMHLSRMKTDCRYMEQLLAELDEQYEVEMCKKFGMMVDLDELEEGILRRMVYDIRANLDAVQKEYNGKAKELRAEYAKAQEQLKCVVEQEIEKLNVLTVLQEEENWLQRIARNRGKAESSPAVDNAAIEADVVKLSAIAKQQKNEIALLTNEINMLRMKAKNFTEISQPSDADDPNLYSSHRGPHSAQGAGSEFSFNTHNSDRSVAQFIAINQIVEAFFEQQKSHVNSQLLHELSQRISIYFASVANSILIATDQRDAQLKEVVENFRQMIPTELWPHFPVVEVAKLFQNLVSTFGLDLAQPQRFPPAELLKSILEDTYDSMNAKGASEAKDLITESLKNLIVGMNIDDIRRPEIVAQLVRSLRGQTQNSVVPDSLDKETIFKDVFTYGAENFVDDLSADVLSNLIADIVDGICKQTGSV